jgi:hypothetical protein
MSGWLPIMLAALLGFAAGHYHLKLRIFRNLLPLTDAEHDEVQAIMRAAKHRAALRGDT